ncbi:MAG: RNA recognition motif domain-containing protein [Candidatus Binataceae bacterium]
MRLFIAPIDFYATVDGARDLFLPFGEVSNVIVPPNKERPWQTTKGFAFVDMPDPIEARRAIVALHEQIVNDKRLQVAEARGGSARISWRSLGEKMASRAR